VRPVAEIALFTTDVMATASFYAGVLGATPVAEWPGGAIFEAGDAKLLVHERSSALESGPPNEDHVAFSVADLDAACNELRAHGRSLLVAPREYPWGRSAYLRDPDGRLVELTEDSG
jgi:catechol 2,3-dioxygenase-like lactoylglutathione lyase family enzyme